MAAPGFQNRTFTNKKLIIFDLDGTLVDAFADITAAVNYMLSRMGLPPRTIDEVKLHVGNGARALVGGILQTDDPEVITANHAHLVEYYHNHSTAHATLYERVVETLDELKQRGIKLTVVSNKPDALTQKVIRDLEVDDLFERILGESPQFPRKPAPDVVRHIMDEFGVTADETLVVGDSSVDVSFARGAGVDVIAVSYGQTSAADLEALNPDAIVHSISEIPALLQ